VFVDDILNNDIDVPLRSVMRVLSLHLRVQCLVRLELCDGGEVRINAWPLRYDLFLVLSVGLGATDVVVMNYG
jgi:hypothetical protein